MKVEQALECAVMAAEDKNPWAEALKALADEVKRLREQPSPRSMESAPGSKLYASQRLCAMWKRRALLAFKPLDDAAKVSGWVLVRDSECAGQAGEYVKSPRSWIAEIVGLKCRITVERGELSIEVIKPEGEIFDIYSDETTAAGGSGEGE